MRKPTLLIADKDSGLRENLQQLIKNLGRSAVFWECCNGLETIRYINALQPDLVFMNVDLPGKSGFEVLDEATHIPAVVLLSDSPEHAAKAFEYHAVDYLLKPLTSEKLNRAFQKFTGLAVSTGMVPNPHARPATYPPRILVEKGNRLIGVPVSKITHVKADKDYSWLHTASGEYFLSTYGIGQLGNKLNPQQFLRIHRSYLVNIDHIQELYRDISKLFIALPNNIEISVGRNYLPVIKELIF